MVDDEVNLGLPTLHLHHAVQGEVIQVPGPFAPWARYTQIVSITAYYLRKEMAEELNT